jgi:GTP cyclohydrolase I
MELTALEDVQGRRDHRQIPLDRAGVRDLRYPIVVLDREHRKQATVAHIAMSVSLPHEFKGTHMSRFVEVLNLYRGEMTLRTLPALLQELRKRLDAESAQIHVTFPYFIERSAPASGATGLMDYECSFSGELRAGLQDFVLGVKVPVTSVCPCSKAISDYGAHNQRGQIDINVSSARVGTDEPPIIWIEEMVELAERSASAPVYPLLKRADERHVTMLAYDNPVFVEDMVRNVACELQGDHRVARFAVEAVNYESIHNHSAFAATSWERPAC